MKLTFKIWLLIFVLAFALLSIFSFPPTYFDKGVLITSIEQNSTAFISGLRQGQIITSIDGDAIKNTPDYVNKIQIFSDNQTRKMIISTRENEFVYYSDIYPQITVSDIPRTNIKTGLDLAGGSRALVQTKGEKLTSQQANDLADVIRNRLNVYGIEDMNVFPTSDLSGNYYVKIEIAGATPKDLENLVSQQGKFEAKVGDQVVFSGGEKDISSVCTSSQCSRIECSQSQQTPKYCNFMFSIYLSENAAKRFGEITKDISINSSNPEYLEKTIDFYIDDNLVSSLQIGKDLKGSSEPIHSIQGSGKGEDTEAAYKDAQEEMKRLQTVLKTGSLPYQLEIVKLDTISPVLGKDFIRAIFIAGLAALLAVSIVVFIRYRNLKSSLALLLTSVSEIIIILGVASFIEWNLDLASIAGILATIGTGIDSQIIVLDESRQGNSLSLKQKLKRAFTIILGAYFTAVVSLIPLWWAGAGLFKGFVFTTIIGMTVGVLITRPAFSDIIKLIGE